MCLIQLKSRNRHMTSRMSYFFQIGYEIKEKWRNGRDSNPRPPA
jgi:hypothetical protein